VALPHRVAVTVTGTAHLPAHQLVSPVRQPRRHSAPLDTGPRPEIHRLPSRVLTLAGTPKLSSRIIIVVGIRERRRALLHHSPAHLPLHSPARPLSSQERPLPSPVRLPSSPITTHRPLEARLPSLVPLGMVSNPRMEARIPADRPQAEAGEAGSPSSYRPLHNVVLENS